MSYRIAQDFEYVGKDYWRWSAWIEGDDAELNKVKEVVWILHPSFKRTRIATNDRNNKFRLRSAGWGTFQLKAEVLLADGDTLLLKRSLKLEYPEGSGHSQDFIPSKERPPTVYLSYSTEDSRVVAKLRTGLESAGLKVLDQTRVVAGEPYSEALRRMITESDGIIGFVSEGDVSPWVSAEIKTAASYAKPTLVLFAEGASTAGLPNDIHARQVDVNDLNSTEIAGLLRSLGQD
jgi:hypothetical protein